MTAVRLTNAAVRGGRDWEAQLQVWARGPSATETEKMERAERAIHQAIRKSAKLSAHDVIVRPQGSYYNRTNVPGESDVDTRTVIRDVFITEWQLVDNRARTDADVVAALDRAVGNVSVSYTFADYKNEVQEALEDHFGPPPAVIRGDKAFDIHENTYRVESDCLPAFELRLYSRDALGRITHSKGIAFRTDSGRLIQNYPDQQYANGVAKHDRTGRRFKKMVRILKNLRNEMNAKGIKEAGPIPSFLSECLVWNVPDFLFNRGSYLDDFRGVLASLYVDLGDAEKCEKWTEENGIKYLFHWSQGWTRADAHAFIKAAWVYMGFT